MARTKSNGEGDPCTVDEGLVALVVTLSRIVSARHPDWPRETLFTAGLSLGLQVGVDAPPVASRYVEALKRAGRLRGTRLFSDKMAEALEILAESEGGG